MTTREQDTPTAGALAAQALFEAMFDHQPKIDLTRPPHRPGRPDSPSAAERAAWRKEAA
jgi:hypothetical protein